LVWKAWTDSSEAETFFAPRANIEPRPGGAYEMLFLPNAPKGQQGSEGAKILKIQLEHELLFTWNAPPQFGEIREQRTQVQVLFTAVDADHTRVELIQTRFGTGAAWDAVYGYFQRAWDKVLDNMVTRFSTGPIDWKTP
jgi:uncharacterized protein YndB with AHSA1/START domain